MPPNDPKFRTSFGDKFGRNSGKSGKMNSPVELLLGTGLISADIFIFDIDVMEATPVVADFFALL